MIEKILVHLDPSRPQRRARQLAADLARRLGARLLALYVVDERALMGAEPVAAVQDALTAIGESSLSDYGEELGEGVGFDRFIGYGDTAKTVAHYVRREGADLVVTGGFHMAAYERVPFGSVVNDMVHRVHANVLLVRDYHELPREAAPIMQMYGADKGSVKALYGAVPFAKAFGGGLVAAHVARRRDWSEAETMLMTAKAHEDKLEVPLSLELLEKGAFVPSWRAITRAGKRHSASMISIGRSYVAPAFVRPMSPIEQLVVHTKTPLLVQWDE